MRASSFALRAERSAVVEERPQIPLAVPRGTFQRGLEIGRPRTPLRRDRMSRAPRRVRRMHSRIACRNHPSQTLSPLPSAPTRFMPSFQSPFPISGSSCGPSRQPCSSARAQCSHSGAVCCDTVGLNIRSCSPSARSGPSRNGIASSRMPLSPVTLHILRHHKRQPQQIVGATRSHPDARVPDATSAARRPR